MKTLKICLIILGSLVVIFLLFFANYLISHRQGVITTKEVPQPSAKFNVLIASQGSSFKNSLVDNLVYILKEKPVNVKIIDVTGLDEINESDWNALILIHTTEKWQMQPDVKAFLDRAKDLTKIMLITTSGDGKWRTKDYNVDVITSASANKELSPITRQIQEWLKTRLQ